MDCNCEKKECSIVEEKKPESIPFIVYEAEKFRDKESHEKEIARLIEAHKKETERNERHEKRHIIAIIVAVAALFLSNLIWLWCWMQYDYASYSVSTDGVGNAYYNDQSGDGEIYNGTNPSTEKNAENGQ